MKDNLKDGYYIGIVENNVDPEKKQRIQIRIPFLHGTAEEIPTEYLPWARPERDRDGKEYSVPAVNKIVTVYFPSGSLYMPVYKETLHLDLNLQKKLETYSEEDLVSFKSFCYDYNTQIYRDSTNLYMIHNDGGLIINDTGDITARLKNKNGQFKIGDDGASQSMILGNNFLNWMDDFLQQLATGFIGNIGVTCVMSPNLINSIATYNSMKRSYLSDIAFISENGTVSEFTESTTADIADKYLLTNKEKIVSTEAIENSAKQEEVKATEKESVEQAKENTKGNIEDELINEKDNIMNNPEELERTYQELQLIDSASIPESIESDNVVQSSLSDADDIGDWQFEDDFSSIYDEDEGIQNNINEEFDPNTDSIFTPPPTATPIPFPDNGANSASGVATSGSKAAFINYNTRREPLDLTLLPKPGMISHVLTLDKVLKSDAASRLKLDNSPDNNDHLKNLIMVTNRYFDPVYKYFKSRGYTLIVSSGYRSLAVNNAVGGSNTSQHKTGSALDLILVKDSDKKRYNNLLFYYLKNTMQNYGQLIWEYSCKSAHPGLDGDNGPQWVHISLNNAGKKGHCFAIGSTIQREHQNTINVLNGEII